MYENYLLDAHAIQSVDECAGRAYGLFLKPLSGRTFSGFIDGGLTESKNTFNLPSDQSLGIVGIGADRCFERAVFGSSGNLDYRTTPTRVSYELATITIPRSSGAGRRKERRRLIM